MSRAPGRSTLSTSCPWLAWSREQLRTWHVRPVSLLVFVACGAVVVDGSGSVRSAAFAAGPATDEPAPRRSVFPSARLLTCGVPGLSFRPRALRNRRGYERRKNPAARALRAFLREEADEVFQPARGWFFLTRARRRIQFAHGRLPELGRLEFERRGRRWEWMSSGGCAPRSYRRPYAASLWKRDGSKGTLTPQARRIPLLVQEDQCTSGRDARGRILRPLVHYGRTTVTVTYFIRPLGGVNTCQGVPPTPVTLPLDEPLGNRRLRDGGTFPPARR